MLKSLGKEMTRSRAIKVIVSPSYGLGIQLYPLESSLIGVTWIFCSLVSENDSCCRFSSSLSFDSSSSILLNLTLLGGQANDTVILLIHPFNAYQIIRGSFTEPVFSHTFFKFRSEIPVVTGFRVFQKSGVKTPTHCFERSL